MLARESHGFVRYIRHVWRQLERREASRTRRALEMQAYGMRTAENRDSAQQQSQPSKPRGHHAVTKHQSVASSDHESCS